MQRLRVLQYRKQVNKRYIWTELEASKKKEFTKRKLLLQRGNNNKHINIDHTNHEHAARKTVQLSMWYVWPKI